MVNHFKQNVSKLDKTPQDSIGVIATEVQINTSVDCGLEVKPDLEFRVDWLQGTFNVKYLDKVHRLVSSFLGGGEFEERASGIRYFEKSYKHPAGAISGVGQKIPGGSVVKSWAYIELSGSVLENRKQSELRKLMRDLRDKCKFKCTHNDLTIDDYGKSFTIQQVKEAYDKNYVVGFGDTGDYKELGRFGSKGCQFSVGNRGSKGGGKRMVFYDKFKESKGKIDSYRIELATYDVYAQQSFEQLCDLPFLCWGDLIGGWISGAIDFRMRKNEKDKNPGRRPRLLWWDMIIQALPKIKPSREYKSDSLHKLKSWFIKQVAPSLAIFIYVMKDDFWDFFWSCVYDGEARFREKHRYLINSC